MSGAGSRAEGARRRLLWHAVGRAGLQEAGAVAAAISSAPLPPPMSRLAGAACSTWWRAWCCARAAPPPSSSLPAPPSSTTLTSTRATPTWSCGWASHPCTCVGARRGAGAGRGGAPACRRRRTLPHTSPCLPHSSPFPAVPSPQCTHPQISFTILLVVEAVLYSPAEPTSCALILHTSLQQFAWTEDEVRGQGRARRCRCGAACPDASCAAGTQAPARPPPARAARRLRRFRQRGGCPTSLCFVSRRPSSSAISICTRTVTSSLRARSPA